MKIKRCSVYRFGKLKDKDLEFKDGITLIQGPNESGKTTLHTAIAALLFGVERNRGRAAANDTYKANLPWTEPELYGGSIDWERDGSRIHAVRDLAKTPPRSFLNETKDGRTRDIKENEQPLPDSLTPYLFYNTLSFRQMGSGLESGMADELRSHIINLQGSGNESMDVAAALADLKNRRRELQKGLREEAEAENTALDQELRELERAGFQSLPDGWSEAGDALRRQDALAQKMTAERDQLTQDIARKKKILSELKIQDQEVLEEDCEKAAVLAEQLKVYEEDYEPKMPAPGLVRALSYLTLPFMLLFFWQILNGLQYRQYLRCAIGVVGLFVTMLISTRYARRSDALDAQKQNKELLIRMLAVYVPDHEGQGTVKEAEELAAYLERIKGLYGEIEQQEAEREAGTADLVEVLSRREALSRRMEKELSVKVRREQWEARVRAALDRKEQLKPVLKENARLKEELAALDLARSTLSSLATGVYSDFGAPLTAEASGIFSQITGGHYDGVRISDKLEIYAVQQGRLVAPGALSGGTMQQLYFAFRMAIIRLLWPDEPMPLFFDDAFAYYDKERLAALLKWLHENYKGQIFLFTCQNREGGLLEEAGIPFEKIEL